MAEIVPVLQALLVADHIYRDVTTGKHIICGVFGTLFRAPPTPVGETINIAPGSERQAGFRSGSPFAYLSLIDIEGEQQLSLRYVRLNDEIVFFEADLKVPAGHDRLQLFELMIPLPPLPVEVGVYALELLWNNTEPLGSYRITVVQRENEVTQ